MAAIAGALLLGVAPIAAQAQVSLDAPDSALIQLGAGGYDIIGANSRSAGIFRGEYRFERLWYIRPLIGAEVTTDGSFYGYGGLALDIYLGDSWVLTPNEAVGYWSRGNNHAQDLGNDVEFRSGAELDYRFGDWSRLGVSFHHISNAGLGTHNPGEEEVLLNYSIPMGGPVAPASYTPPPTPAPPPPAPQVEAARSFQVFFDFNKATITAAAAKVVQRAADTVKAGGVAHIEVIGHTDTVGGAAYNQKLSEARAAAVKGQLVADGVPGGEIVTRGVGKTGLLVPTADGVREAQNRRAEIDLQ
jgi:outer membrane protein OmpA-like peptidoglycan-associated protein